MTSPSNDKIRKKKTKIFEYQIMKEEIQVLNKDMQHVHIYCNLGNANKHEKYCF